MACVYNSGFVRGLLHHIALASQTTSHFDPICLSRLDTTRRPLVDPKDNLPMVTNPRMLVSSSETVDHDRRKTDALVDHDDGGARRGTPDRRTHRTVRVAWCSNCQIDEQRKQTRQCYLVSSVCGKHTSGAQAFGVRDGGVEGWTGPKRQGTGRLVPQAGPGWV